MQSARRISVPTLVRARDGSLDRLGAYLGRAGHRKVAVLISQGLHPPLPERVARSLKERAVEALAWVEVRDNDLESAARLFADLPAQVAAVVGVGGGKALDVA